ncbi:MAG: hypothetical protein WCX75_08995 [Fibrobacteraceae bacterium]
MNHNIRDSSIAEDTGRRQGHRYAHRRHFLRATITSDNTSSK